MLNAEKCQGSKTSLRPGKLFIGRTKYLLAQAVATKTFSSIDSEVTTS